MFFIDVIGAYRDRLEKDLKLMDEVEVVVGEAIIWTSGLAKMKAVPLAESYVEMPICNFALCSFPHLPAIPTRFVPGPFFLFSNTNSQHPGLESILTSIGALDQIGELHGRVWGDVGDEKVTSKVMKFLRAAAVVNRLKGETFRAF